MLLVALVGVVFLAKNLSPLIEAGVAAILSWQAKSPA